ncbi:MAG TPA: hypothetical protein VNP04_26040 [Alphaproteobacteria bacterium]|nr:hypothetical protein [Alphaproteobacteria bacterium]
MARAGDARSAVRRIAVTVVGGISAFILAVPAAAWACAVCIGASAEDQGYFWGVLFLMATPFLVAGSIGGWILYHHRRGRGTAAHSPAGRDLQ